MSLSSSNCHGESVAMALDMLAIALTELSSISERRTFRMTSAPTIVDFLRSCRRTRAPTLGT